MLMACFPMFQEVYVISLINVDGMFSYAPGMLFLSWPDYLIFMINILSNAIHNRTLSITLVLSGSTCYQNYIINFHIAWCFILYQETLK